MDRGSFAQGLVTRGAQAEGSEEEAPPPEDSDAQSVDETEVSPKLKSMYAVVVHCLCSFCKDSSEDRLDSRCGV